MKTGLCIEATGHTLASLTASSQVTQHLVYSQSLSFQSYYEKIILSPFMDFVVEEKHNPLDVTSNLDFIYLFTFHDCYTNLVVCRVVILIIPVHP